MTLLSELTETFPWGVLLVADAASTELIPDWASSDEQVTHAESALVVRVRHQDEGAVHVRVWRGDGTPSGAVAFTGSIDVASGVLTISDALNERVLRVALVPGAHTIEIYTDAVSEATQVHIVLDPAN